MRVIQQLINGSTIEQNIHDAIRFVFFDTGEEGWRYATYAGVLFLVSYNGTVYGVTAKHVFQDFNWRQLVVTKQKFGEQGEMVAELDTLAYPTALEGAAEGSDIGDIAIIKFSPRCQSDFFLETAYLIDPGTIALSRSGDLLTVYGSLKSQSSTDEEGVVTPRFCTFTELTDEGLSDGNPTLRRATITFSDEIEFDSITGISGGAVFNQTQEKLCGMVVRGGLSGYQGTVWYLDISDIVYFIRGIDGGHERVGYERIAYR